MHTHTHVHTEKNEYTHIRPLTCIMRSTSSSTLYLQAREFKNLIRGEWKRITGWGTSKKVSVDVCWSLVSVCWSLVDVCWCWSLVGVWWSLVDVCWSARCWTKVYGHIYHLYSYRPLPPDVSTQLSIHLLLVYHPSPSTLSALDSVAHHFCSLPYQQRPAPFVQTAHMLQLKLPFESQLPSLVSVSGRSIIPPWSFNHPPCHTSFILSQPHLSAPLTINSNVLPDRKPLI